MLQDENRSEKLKKLLADAGGDVGKELKPYEWAAAFGALLCALLFVVSGWLWIRRGETKWSGLCPACLFLSVAGLAVLYWRTERWKGVLGAICAAGIFAVLLFMNE